ncbi:MerR family transcriptional regulator [Embleya sp. AB8]|uniref:MerR family transcriptional regulator n=1 Tax=Embleya sp. AB8 TaxID=3156304 RepID=UPI003C70D3EC
MRIGELAAQTGASIRSLRYYEEQGLLTSIRSAGGQRHYTDDQIARVAFVQSLYAAGLSSRAIVELLPCVDSPSDDHSDAAMARMLQERDRLSDHIEELHRTRDALDALMAAARAYRDTREGNCSATTAASLT